MVEVVCFVLAEVFTSVVLLAQNKEHLWKTKWKCTYRSDTLNPYGLYSSLQLECRHKTYGSTVPFRKSIGAFLK